MESASKYTVRLGDSKVRKSLLQFKRCLIRVRNCGQTAQRADCRTKQIACSRDQSSSLPASGTCQNNDITLRRDRCPLISVQTVYIVGEQPR